MDPFSISAGAAGFLSLAIEITKILKAYVDGVRSAPEEARNLLAEVTALCDILKPFLEFLKDDYNGNFTATSALVLAINAYKDHIEKLYKQIKNMKVKCEEGKIAQAMERLKWPLRKEDYERTMATIQRFTQTFQFSLTVENCKLLAKTYEEVLAEFKAKEKQMEQTLESFRTMKLPGIEALLTASKEQSIILGDVSKTIELGQETQKKILSVAQNTNRIANDQEMESLLQWISPLEPQTRHQDVRSKRLVNIGNWFLESEIFQNWRDDSDAVNIFGCYGIPGAGKTFITSLVIDHLGGFAGGKTCIAFIYCDYNEAKEQTPVNMIGGLLKQAITASKEVSTDIIDTLLEKKKSRQAIEVKDAVHSLSRLLNGFEKTYICIDALDECNETDRRQLIQSLVEISSSSDGKKSQPIRLFFTGRPPMEKYVISHASVAPEIPLMVKLEASTEDITAYIAQKIDEDKMVGMDDDFKQHIVEAIVSASKGMFLLPALQISAVLDEPTIRKRREALKDLPRELYDAFAITLDRIRAQKKSMSSLAMKVLKWTFLSVRPLSLEELHYALAIEPGDAELHRDNFVEPQLILDCCLGLVIVDESTSTVRLVHKSLQDYFQDLYDEGSLFNEGHMEIASICMTYMSFHHLSLKLPVIGSEIADRYPLLGYAVYRWDYHLRSSKTRNREVEEIAFTFVTEKYKSQLAPRKFLTIGLQDRLWSVVYDENWCLNNECSRSINPELSTQTFPLHIAASTGSPELFCRVIDTVNRDINEMDTWGNYGLTMAAALGHTSVIEIMLKPPYKAEVNVGTKYGQTALSLASEKGHTEVVKLLLETNGVDVNKANRAGVTPLLFAIRNGHFEVVKLLLEKNGIDVNKAGDDDDGNTPLLFALRRRHLEVVKLLLEQNGVDVNKADLSGYTPLFWAAAGGHLEVVKLLFQKRCHMDTAANDGETPLMIAARYGRLETVKLLLEQNGVDVNKAYRDGDTALLFAADNGQLEVVKVLLEKDGVEINKANDDGDTPFLSAARNGHLEVVELLLEKTGDYVNKADSAGHTPLWWAAAGGHLEVVKLLFQKYGDDVDKAANNGCTPLMVAALHGYAEVVKFLLEKNCVDINKTEGYGDTPLLYAARNGNSEVVKLLIQHGAAVETRNNDGRIALSLAAQHHRLETLNILLQSSADVNMTDGIYGRTPLIWSFYHPWYREQRNDYHNRNIPEALLSQHGIDVNWQAKDGSTALSRAIECQLHDVEELLRAHGAV